MSHLARSIRWPVLAAAVAACLALGAGPARAQQPAPSPAALADAAQPVRVVCVADSAEAFLGDQTFRDHVLARLPAALAPAREADATRRLRDLIAPLGRRFVVPVGSGFVVDPERRHVITGWSVVTACASDRSVDRSRGRQVGILEPDGVDVVAVLAERLPDRTFQDAAGTPVKLVQALCRDRQEPCSADLPRGPDDRPVPDSLRRRQLDNLLAYAPDLAVLRLPAPSRAPPLALAVNQQLDDQMRLVIRSQGPVPVGTTAADAAARLHLVAPVSVGAVYTGPHQISHLPPAGQPGHEIHARLHRLAAAVQPGQTGAPVMRGAGVVGVLTTLPDPARPASDAMAPVYAVPVTVVAVFLDLLKVPYAVAPLDLPAVAAPAADPPAAPAGWAQPQRLMLAGAAVLAVLAGLAFAWLARRPAPTPAAAGLPLPPAPTQRTTSRTVSRVNPTILHAMALPTAATEPEPDPAAPAGANPGPARPPSSVVRARLRCSAGPLAPSVFELPMPNGGATLFVGRDAQSCQVVLPPVMDLVSAVHVCFVWDAASATLTVRDLSSSGTWLNGQRLPKGRTLPLAAGDKVDLGGPDINRFTIELPGAPLPGPSA